jgi:hypothetical protein
MVEIMTLEISHSPPTAPLHPAPSGHCQPAKVVLRLSVNIHVSRMARWLEGAIREFPGVRSFNILRDVWRQLIYGAFFCDFFFCVLLTVTYTLSKNLYCD